MKCIECEHFKVYCKPQITEPGIIECRKYGLVIDWFKNQKLNELVCVKERCRMTIDEAIEHCKEIARDNRAKADEEYRAFAIYPFVNAEESATFVDRCDECAEQHEQLVGWLEKLKEYQDLEEQGLLLKLPVAIEQEVYRVNHVIIPMTVKEITYALPYKGTKPVFLIKTVENKYYGENYYFLEDIGKTVFLTKEEAEKELKGLEGAE